ncbi:MAG: OmpH family outer membrane protein [Bacteroidaceae bacterium]|nr:OmpH family outer membrane protein [Bacteroidaceae bacterium]
MRRILLSLLIALPLGAMAQKIGYLSYQGVRDRMPEYAQAKDGIKTLKAQYDQEAKRTEDEFQRKFTEFLQGQKDFPQNILVKRQAELQTLMESGMKFRREAHELLIKAEQEVMAGVDKKLNEAIKAVGAQGYICILNTDGNLCPYFSPEMSEDVTLPVLKQLGIVADEPSVATAAEPAPATAE